MWWLRDNIGRWLLMDACDKTMWRWAVQEHIPSGNLVNMQTYVFRCCLVFLGLCPLLLMHGSGQAHLGALPSKLPIKQQGKTDSLVKSSFHRSKMRSFVS